MIGMRPLPYSTGLLLGGDKQSVDVGVGHGFGAGAAVDDQGGAAGSDPDEVVAHGEDVADAGMAFKDAEVRFARGLDRYGLHLGLVGFVNPDAADFKGVPGAEPALGALGQPDLVP